jgi:predicted nucleic acid-binding protein
VTTYLLDANVLIALTVAEHVDHKRASLWAEGVDSFAVCPIVEGAVMRFIVRLGGTVKDGLRVLRHVEQRDGYHFWPDGLSYRQAQLDHIVGHRQVTDAYLASLAASKPYGRLATMDEGLVGALPHSTELVPRLL